MTLWFVSSLQPNAKVPVEKLQLKQQVKCFWTEQENLYIEDRENNSKRNENNTKKQSMKKYWHGKIN